MSERRIAIAANGINIIAKLNQSMTADALWNALPITATAQIWGDELYFSTPVDAPDEDVQETVNKGAVAYWPPGKALCWFWGPTPMSRGDEIRPASPVNILGHIESEPEELSQIPAGSEITVRQVRESRTEGPARTGAEN